MSDCADLIYGGRLAFSAANSMGFIAGCPANSWVGQNHALFNIANSICTYGYDEECTLDLAVGNQPSCPHQLGAQPKLDSCPVYDIEYGTGRRVLAI